MDRRSFIKNAGLSGLTVAGASLAAPAIAQENLKITWRMASAFPSDLDTITDTLRTIIADVAAASDGNFVIELAREGESALGGQVLDDVRSGRLDACQTCSYYDSDKDPAYALGTAIPFGLNARLANAWFYSGGGIDLLNGFYATQGLYALPAGNTGTQMGGWFQKEINTLDDLKGLNMRIAGLAGKVMEKVGVVVHQMPGSAIAGAMEKGTIDACEWIGPYDDLKLGIHKIAKYYYYPGWWEGGATVHAFFNLEKWNALPKRYQTILENACAFANHRMLAKYDSENPAALKQLVAEGAVLRPFTQDIMNTCFEAARALYGDIAQSNVFFKDIYTKQMDFQRDAYLWLQLPDYTYDTFMIIQQRAGKL